ncbi:EcsC family protein [Salisaeta longa]|uniref:EcsC family protein n=1 Tax=Salisaeta longa TaxID=503170 RepID=UPI0003B3B6DE|nr:EcsC family protein [Salisaeta longa]
MADSTLTQKAILTTLDRLYDYAVNGGAASIGLATAPDLASSYRTQAGSADAAARKLVRWQTGKAATAGFVTNLGGIATLPVAVPANLTSVLYIQLRMVAAIADLSGHDLQDDRVQTLAFACLTGKSTADLLKRAGVVAGKKLYVAGVKRIAGATLTKINKAVGFRLVTKFGKTGVVNLGKGVPLIGGIVGGGFDGGSTYAVGKAARNLFRP